MRRLITRATSGPRSLAAYTATSVLAVVLVALDPATRRAELAFAALLLGMVHLLASFLPWRALPRGVRLVPVALFFFAGFVLRDAAGTKTAGVGIVCLLPICWLALYGSRRELSAGLAGLAAFWVLPVVLIGGEDYPLAQLRTAALYLAVAGMLGLTVSNLVRALAANASNVARVARAARSVHTATDARTEICSAACEVAGATFAFLFEPAGDGALHTTAMAGIAVDGSTIGSDSGTSATWLAFTQQQPVLAADADGHPALNREIWASHGRPASMLFEPVQRAEKTVGVLVVGWAHRVSDLRSGRPALIGLLAAEAATAIAHTDLVRQLGQLADTDALTGLPNRRTWDRELDAVLAGDGAADTCVAMLDLDHFKLYNDTHGHLAGDRQLKASATCWRAQLRASDLLARIGGEEFAVLLHGCSLDVAHAIVQRLLDATPGAATCSAGLVAHRPGESAEALMGRADAALYAAKAQGRDRVAVGALATR